MFGSYRALIPRIDFELFNFNINVFMSSPLTCCMHHTPCIIASHLCYAIVLLLAAQVTSLCLRACSDGFGHVTTCALW